MKTPNFDIASARFEGQLLDGRQVIVTEMKYIWAVNNDGTVEFEGYVPQN
jgi:hypothetical protein